MQSILSYKFFFLLFFLMFLSSLSINAQRDLSKVASYFPYQSLENIDPKIKPKAFFEYHESKMNLGENSEMRLFKITNGHNNYKHFKYKQFYKNIPVFGSQYILHTKDEKVIYANGNFLPKIDLDITEVVNKDKATEIAFDQFKKEYKNADIVESSKYNGLYIIDQYYPSHSNEYAVVHELIIESKDHLFKHKYLIDIKTGKTVFDVSLILHQSVNGTAQCSYYGLQNITIDSISQTEYVLRDLEKGDGITTTKYDPNQLFYNDSKDWDLENEEGDEVALDVHYCTLAFYDYLIAHFNWNGLDNEGKSMNPVIHANNGRNFVNAYWNGENAYFGNGDCHRAPLTTAEIVAHEFMHGITQFTSELVYRNESGAINESLSDIFGKALEYEIDINGFDWFIGESIIENDKLDPFRSMENPNQFGAPSYYKGEYWRDGGGVHSNSGVGNKWFYLLVNGGDGLTENNDSFSIDGIGMDKAAQIVFNTASNYLVSNSDYNDFYRQSKKSAEEIYGLDSDEYNNLVKAWKAVGLPYGTIIDDLDLSIKYPEKDFIISTCIQDEYFDFNIVVNNNSTTDYLPEYGAKLIFEYANPDLVLSIDEAIEAGDSLVMNISNLFYFDESRDYNTNVILDFVDYNANNNREFIYVSNSISNEPDLEIEGRPQSSVCFDEQVSISVFLENLGCELSSNEDIFLSIEDLNGKIMWSQTINMDDPYGQNSTLIYVARFEQQDDNNTYFLKLENDSDSNDQNNVQEITIRNNAPISDEYLNQFSTEQELNATLSLYSHISTFNTPLYIYNGEIYFASSGYAQNLLQPACEGGANVLFEESNLTQGLTSSMELCLDLSGMINPKLSFDMIHFQNQENEVYDDFVDYATMLKVSWDGNELGEEIFLAQQEGIEESHSLQLPQDFIGTLNIAFFTLTGTSINNSEFLDYDVILFDNLKISSEPLANKIPINNSPKIFPNPNNGFINLESSLEFSSIEIININGELVKVIDTNGSFKLLNVRDLNDGYYIINFITRKGETHKTPIVITK